MKPEEDIMKTLNTVAILLAVFLLIPAGSAFAGRGGHQDHRQGQRMEQRMHQRGHTPGRHFAGQRQHYAHGKHFRRPAYRQHYRHQARAFHHRGQRFHQNYRHNRWAKRHWHR
ncbi:hypothetical protein DQK91_01135 [Oceanidesulfovibrio marinus]|uniref:Uncharacterized protein n=1 Tax=Oceanidesulfovibrio marinus TaxID=370038 RepID=A0A6P1ZM20_9BACT|nr:hypothetical protein DQK91_01135 [Oceanidesulfovibrio marinus]